MQSTGVKMVDVATAAVTSVAAGGFSAGQGQFGSIAASPTANLILVAADDGAGNLNHYTALNSETGAQVGAIFPMASRSGALTFGPTGVAYSSELFVPASPGDIDVIDASVPLVTGQFAVGATVSETLVALAVAAPAGQTPLLFVGASDSGVSYFKVINTTTGAVDATVSLPDMPVRIAASPSGDRVFISQQQSNTVRVYDALSRALVATISVGSGPNGLAVSPDGRFLFVANTFSNTLSKVDLTSFTVVETIATSPFPSKVAIGPAGCVSVEPPAPATTAAPATTTEPATTAAPATTTVPATNVASASTVAPATTVASATTAAPATTNVATAFAPATTVASTSTVAPATTVVSTTGDVVARANTSRQSPLTSLPSTGQSGAGTNVFLALLLLVMGMFVIWLARRMSRSA
jgi:YVTN family beta-propeller protein